MSDRAKTKSQLKQDLDSKIIGLQILLETAFKKDEESAERIELSNMIAANLRAILCGDRNNGYKSLVERADYHKRLLFPLYDSMACLSIIPTYNLLGFIINSNDGASVFANENVFRNDKGHWGIYLTFETWLNEIVVDTKLKEIEPLTRYDLIKITADTMGAHVDNEIERHIYEMSKHDLLPVVISNGKEVERNLEVKAKTILCETILAIAQELVISFERYKNSSIDIIGPSKHNIRLQKFLFNSSSKKEPIKIGTAPVNEPCLSHTYNSNSFYECEIYEKICSNYQIKTSKNSFVSIVVDYLDVLSNGDYVENSIYGKDPFYK